MDCASSCSSSLFSVTSSFSCGSAPVWWTTSSVSSVSSWSCVSRHWPAPGVAVGHSTHCHIMFPSTDTMQSPGIIMVSQVHPRFISTDHLGPVERPLTEMFKSSHHKQYSGEGVSVHDEVQNEFLNVHRFYLRTICFLFNLNGRMF